MSEPQTQESLSLIVQRISRLVHEARSLGMTHLVVNLECMQCLLIFEVVNWLNDDSSVSNNRRGRALRASKDSIEAMPRLESLSLKSEHCAVCLEGYKRGGEPREIFLQAQVSLELHRVMAQGTRVMPNLSIRYAGCQGRRKRLEEEE